MPNEPWTKDQHPRYLGDGVYVWDEGYQIWIGTKREIWETIALDKGTVIQPLLNYIFERI